MIVVIILDSLIFAEIAQENVNKERKSLKEFKN